MAVSCPEVMYGAYYPYLYGRAGPSRSFYQYERVSKLFVSNAIYSKFLTIWFGFILNIAWITKGNLCVNNFNSCVYIFFFDRGDGGYCTLISVTFMFNTEQISENLLDLNYLIEHATETAQLDNRRNSRNHKPVKLHIWFTISMRMISIHALRNTNKTLISNHC